tara:strand:- start:58 stop:876 length:819 start_codon:yes stop_codon:yes gene_type:complete
MVLKSMKHLANRYLTLWLAFFRNTLSRDMEFKLNFIFEMFIDAVYYGSLFLFFQIIFQFTDSLGDFSKDAVIIFLLTVYISDLLYVFFLGGNVFGINEKVKTGDLDFILLKPMNSQFFISCRYVTTNALISLFILVVLLLRLAYIYHGGVILFENYFIYLISVFLGMFIFYSFEFMISCLSFWFRNFSYAGWLASELIKYSKRPDSIYKNWFRKSLFTIFPMALISSVPARMLIFGVNYKLLLLQFFIALFFLYLTTIIWKKGLKLYESASS